MTGTRFAESSQTEFKDLSVPRQSTYDASIAPFISTSKESSSFCYIERIPPEILAKIFLLANGQQGIPIHDDPNRASDAPMIFSSVDRLWRQIATETPQLWTYIHISHRRPNFLLQTLAHIERSGDLPLDITIWWRPSDEPLNKFRGKRADKASTALFHKTVKTWSGVIEEQLQALLRYTGRWRSFQLMLDSLELMHTHLTWLVPVSAPGLTHLSLVYEDIVNHMEETHLYEPVGPLFTGGSPLAISTVMVHGVSVKLLPHPCRHLRSLHLGQSEDCPVYSPPLPELLNFINGSSLRDLQFTQILCEGEFTPNSDVWPHEVVRLPSLEKLHIQDDFTFWVTTFLARTHIPNLRILELRLEKVYESYDEFVDTMVRPYADLQRSMLRSVQALQITNLPYERDLYLDSQSSDIPIYHELDNLRVIMVDCSSGRCCYDAFPERLLRFTCFPSQLDFPPDHHPRIPLPRLRTVVLRNPNIREVKKLVTARKAAGVPIQRLFLMRGKKYMALDPADALWFSQHLETFAELSSEEDEGYKQFSLLSPPADITLKRLLEADLAAERVGVSFMDVFTRP